MAADTTIAMGCHCRTVAVVARHTTAATHATIGNDRQRTASCTSVVSAHDTRMEPTGVANAFGATFYLAPSFCMKIDREQAFLFSAFLRQPGLAIIVRSEVQPTQHLVELVSAKSTGTEAARALLGADALLGPDANRLLALPNAGGASRVSEAMSVELLSRCFGSRLKQTELEIVYWPSNGSITDYSVELEGTTLGVSVTRAMHSAAAECIDTVRAEALLRKKLGGVLRSTENACGEWTKQILHCWAPNGASADAIEAAYATLEPELTSNTVVLVSVCEGLDLLFEEKSSKCALAKQPKALKGLKDTSHLRVLSESDPLKKDRARVGEVEG
jgi:hypothetical protein